MQIHTVSSGESIFSIARKYSTSPMKIIENNELENPDRLSVGQKLIILSPTRTHTARGGDTLSKIAERYRVRRETLLMNNPYLSGKDSIYPGQILSIKHDTPSYGAVCINGYYYNGCPEERLSLALPYMTHITISEAKHENGKLKRVFNARPIVRAASSAGKRTIMRVYDTSSVEELTESYIDELISLAKDGKYCGICIAAYKAEKEDEECFSQFMEKLHEKAGCENLSVFYEADANKKITREYKSDGCILSYDKCTLSDIPSFDIGERATFDNAAKVLRSEKTFIDFSPFAYEDGEAITQKEALRLAFSMKREIKYDEEKGICHFEYNKYKGGKCENARVVFEAPENIKSKLALIDELGFCGMSFDIMRIPVEHLMSFISAFSVHETSYSESSADM